MWGRAESHDPQIWHQCFPVCTHIVFNEAFPLHGIGILEVCGNYLQVDKTRAASGCLMSNIHGPPPLPRVVRICRDLQGFTGICKGSSADVKEALHSAIWFAILAKWLRRRVQMRGLKSAVELSLGTWMEAGVAG